MEKFLIDYYFDLEDYPHSQLFADCTYVWEPLAQLALLLNGAKLGRIECPVPAGVILINPEKISIGKGTLLEPGAFIQGPCIIGQNCEVRHSAYIRGGVVTGNNCLIGHSTEVKNSILLNDVCAAHFNYVGDSILGNRVNLGAGVKLANLRLDHQIIQIAVEKHKIPTNLKKMGAILGDGTQLGCNAVTNPGTVMGKEVFCHPCVTVNGYIPEKAQVRSTHKMVIQEYVDRCCF